MAIVIGGSIAAAGAIGGAAISSSGSQSAADTQAAASESANALQYQEFQQQLQLQQPWINAGQQALSQLTGSYINAAPTAASANQGQAAPTYTPLNAATFQQTPQSQYLQQKATQAAQNQASATGMQLSGAQLQALQSNAAGLASQDYNTAYAQNLQNYQAQLGAYQQNFANAQATYGLNLNQLQSLAGQGQTASNAATGAAGAYGSAAGANIIGAGNAQAAGQVGSSNAISSGLSSAAGSIGGAYSLSNMLGNTGLGSNAYASQFNTGLDSGLTTSNAGTYDYSSGMNMGSAFGYGS